MEPSSPSRTKYLPRGASTYRLEDPLPGPRARNGFLPDFDKMRRIIELRQENDLTFDEIGKALGISRQRAHQIYSYARAITRARQHKKKGRRKVKIAEVALPVPTEANIGNPDAGVGEASEKPCNAGLTSA